MLSVSYERESFVLGRFCPRDGYVLGGRSCFSSAYTPIKNNDIWRSVDQILRCEVKVKKCPIYGLLLFTEARIQSI